LRRGLARHFAPIGRLIHQFAVLERIAIDGHETGIGKLLFRITILGVLLLPIRLAVAREAAGRLGVRLLAQSVANLPPR